MQHNETKRRNPYSGRPASTDWRKSVAGIAPFELDPLSGIDLPFRLSAGERIATAGSCFAQHIARNLAPAGLTYYVEERAPDEMPAAEAAERQFGLFSARYGNLYTARQLLQLFERAFGHRPSTAIEWQRPDGSYVDPYRPQVEPLGFASQSQMLRARDEHLRSVRTMFETLDTFVFTLGLTESWRVRSCGTVLPLAPGVVAGDWDPRDYEFYNLSATETSEDLSAFITKLREINPSAKIILTVSPVPLIATYENEHVLTSTIYSKSCLRVAAEEVRRKHEQVAYFPSYEIITAPSTRGAYFENDYRSISQAGVSHVMRVFLTHFDAKSPRALGTSPPTWNVQSETKAVSAVVCDEEAISTSNA